MQRTLLNSTVDYLGFPTHEERSTFFSGRPDKRRCQINAATVEALQLQENAGTAWFLFSAISGSWIEA